MSWMRIAGAWIILLAICTACNGPRRGALGPAAAASAAVILGELSPDQGVSVMKTAGTSDNYRGLYSCVLAAAPASASELDAASSEFPEIAPTPDFVKAMAAAQDAFDHLADIRDSGWMTPAAHPDLVPSAEAGRLENLMRDLLDDPEVAEHPADFAKMMAAAHKSTLNFGTALNAGASCEEFISRLKVVRASCEKRHEIHRNNR